MTKLAPLFFIVLAALAVLPGCCAGPSAADVAADRARWIGVRDAVADGKIDEQEAPAMAAMLAAWDSKLASDEAAVNQPRDPKTILLEIVRVYGAALVQVYITPVMQQKAPQLFALLDKNGDGQLTVEELQSANVTDPVFAIVVIDVMRQLLSKK